MGVQSESALKLIRNYLDYQIRLGFGELLVPPKLPGASTIEGLVAVRAQLGECTRCPLHETRRNIVFGEGDPNARLVFVGEGPGAEEDKTGKPFVGKAGGLLTKMIAAMGLDRSNVYIANVVKCRPPRNRDPKSIEIETCLPFLEGQIKAIKPEVIVALGRVAAGALLDSTAQLWKLRGTFHDREGTPVVVTYHPSFLLQREGEREWKAKAWEDLKMVMNFLGLPMPNIGDKA
jgi:uracil-DNA glycosylase family 4